MLDPAKLESLVRAQNYALDRLRDRGIERRRWAAHKSYRTLGFVHAGELGGVPRGDPELERVRRHLVEAPRWSRDGPFDPVMLDSVTVDGVRTAAVVPCPYEWDALVATLPRAMRRGR